MIRRRGATLSSIEIKFEITSVQMTSFASRVLQNVRPESNHSRSGAEPNGREDSHHSHYGAESRLSKMRRRTPYLEMPATISRLLTVVMRRPRSNATP
jgi:hypothetical protein